MYKLIQKYISTFTRSSCQMSTTGELSLDFVGATPSVNFFMIQMVKSTIMITSSFPVESQKRRKVSLGPNKTFTLALSINRFSCQQTLHAVVCCPWLCSAIRKLCFTSDSHLLGMHELENSEDLYVSKRHGKVENACLEYRQIISLSRRDGGKNRRTHD